MFTTLFACALLGTGAPVSQPTTSTLPIAQEDRDGNSKQDEIGMSIYVPEHINAKSLINYAKRTLEDKFVPESRREIFEEMNGVIVVQGRQADRERHLRHIVDLDHRLGAVAKQSGGKRAASESMAATLRVSTISPASAVEMINALGFSVNAKSIGETGTVALFGSTEAVESCKKLIEQADTPLPQITLHCEIIQAHDGGETEHSGVPGDVQKALAALNPGKSFRRTGSVLVRGSVGSGSHVSVRSTLNGSSDDESISLQMSAHPSGFDESTGTLNLSRFEARLLTATPTHVEILQQNGSVLESGGEKTTRESIEASLSLKANETTIVGSLGGEPTYIALRFTID